MNENEERKSEKKFVIIAIILVSIIVLPLIVYIIYLSTIPIEPSWHTQTINKRITISFSDYVIPIDVNENTTLNVKYNCSTKPIKHEVTVQILDSENYGYFKEGYFWWQYDKIYYILFSRNKGSITVDLENEGTYYIVLQNYGFQKNTIDIEITLKWFK